MTRIRHNKTLIGIIALLTLPISVPYFVVKTVRRKTRKARAIQQIEAVDRLATQDTETDPCASDAPLLSIIMPIYNIESYLEASIASVLNQSYRNIELIIVNDASTDGSLMVARMFEQIDDRVRVIDLPQNTLGGAGIPSNIGLERATGKFVAFLDGDDMFCPHAITKLMRRAIAHDCDLTIGSFKNLFDDTKEIEKPYDVSTFSQIPSDEVFSPKDHPKALLISAVPWRKVYKKSFLDAHKISFPEGDLFYEDNPFHWDVLTAAESVIFVPVTVVYHRMNRRGQTKASAAPKLAAYFQHFTAISKRIQKNHGVFAWDPLLRKLDRAHWIVNAQSDPALIDQFLSRFNQVIQEHITPFLSKEHQSSLKRVGYRFETHKTPADLSVIVFHDHKDAREGDLARSIASARAVTDHRAEIFVLHTSDAPLVENRRNDLLMFETNANENRSFNQALQLCTGRYLAFLTSGDMLEHSVVTEALSARSGDVDLLRYTPEAALNPPAARMMLYGRRFVQDNALFFGPTTDGQFSFDTLCTLYATSTMELDESPVRRETRPRGHMSEADTEREAGYLIRQLCAAPIDTSKRQELLETVSAFFDASERSVEATDPSRLAAVRAQASKEVSKARYTGQNLSAVRLGHKDFSGA